MVSIKKKIVRECLLVLIKVGKDANVSKQICSARTFVIAMESAGEESTVVRQGRQRKEMVGKEKNTNYKRQKHVPATKNS